MKKKVNKRESFLIREISSLIAYWLRICTCYIIINDLQSSNFQFFNSEYPQICYNLVFTNINWTKSFLSFSKYDDLSLLNYWSWPIITEPLSLIHYLLFIIIAWYFPNLYKHSFLFNPSTINKNVSSRYTFNP